MEQHPASLIPLSPQPPCSLLAHWDNDACCCPQLSSSSTCGFPSLPGEINDNCFSLKASSSVYPCGLSLNHSGHHSPQGCGSSCSSITTCRAHPFSSWLCRAQTSTGHTQPMLQLLHTGRHHFTTQTAAEQSSGTCQPLTLPSADPAAAASI